MKRKPTKKTSKRKVVKKVSKIKRKKISRKRRNPNPNLKIGKRYHGILNEKFDNKPIHVYFKVINFWSDPEIKEGVVTDEGEILNLADFKEIEEWNPDEEQEWAEYYKYYDTKL